MLVISPLSRGGFVSGDVFDHTSTLKFIARRFGVTVPNLTAWRDATVGDLTSAFNFAKADASVPPLPSTTPVNLAQEAPECASNALSAGGGPGFTEFPPPNPQHMPTQERGARKRPSGVVKCGPFAAGATTNTPGLPATGARRADGPAWPSPWGLTAAAVTLLAALAVRLRMRRGVE
jgi:hypothetical protein